MKSFLFEKNELKTGLDMLGTKRWRVLKTNMTQFKKNVD